MSVLVDTSIWADHFRRIETPLVTLVENGWARMHTFVIGELAMGNLRNRDRTIMLLATLPSVSTVDQDDWLDFVSREALGGSGLGFVDAHLLGAAVVHDLALWTRDRRLAERAEQLGRLWTP